MPFKLSFFALPPLEDALIMMDDDDLDELQQMLDETESIHQHLSPYCSSVSVVGTQGSPQDNSLQDPQVLFGPGSQPIVKSLESGIEAYF